MAKAKQQPASMREQLKGVEVAASAVAPMAIDSNAKALAEYAAGRSGGNTAPATPAKASVGLGLKTTTAVKSEVARFVPKVETAEEVEFKTVFAQIRDDVIPEKIGDAVKALASVFSLDDRATRLTEDALAFVAEHTTSVADMISLAAFNGVDGLTADEKFELQSAARLVAWNAMFANMKPLLGQAEGARNEEEQKYFLQFLGNFFHKTGVTRPPRWHDVSEGGKVVHQKDDLNRMGGRVIYSDNGWKSIVQLQTEHVGAFVGTINDLWRKLNDSERNESRKQAKAWRVKMTSPAGFTLAQGYAGTEGIAVLSLPKGRRRVEVRDRDRKLTGATKMQTDEAALIALKFEGKKGDMYVSLVGAYCSKKPEWFVERAKKVMHPWKQSRVEPKVREFPLSKLACLNPNDSSYDACNALEYMIAEIKELRSPVYAKKTDDDPQYNADMGWLFAQLRRGLLPIFTKDAEEALLVKGKKQISAHESAHGGVGTGIFHNKGGFEWDNKWNQGVFVALTRTEAGMVSVSWPERLQKLFGEGQKAATAGAEYASVAAIPGAAGIVVRNSIVRLTKAAEGKKPAEQTAVNSGDESEEADEAALEMGEEAAGAMPEAETPEAGEATAE